MSMSSIRALLLIIGLTTAASLGVAPASAQTIYDANVASKLEGLSAQQKSQLRQITQQSRSDMMAVFKQFNIDPNAKPNFDKLMQASGPLQAIARKERQAVAKVLEPAQLKQYDRIVADTRTRVRMAAEK